MGIGEAIVDTARGTVATGAYAAEVGVKQVVPRAAKALAAPLAAPALAAGGRLKKFGEWMWKPIADEEERKKQTEAFWKTLEEVKLDKPMRGVVNLAKGGVYMSEMLGDAVKGDYKEYKKWRNVAVRDMYDTQLGHLFRPDLDENAVFMDVSFKNANRMMNIYHVPNLEKVNLSFSELAPAAEGQPPSKGDQLLKQLKEVAANGDRMAAINKFVLGWLQEAFNKAGIDFAKDLDSDTDQYFGLFSWIYHQTLMRFYHIYGVSIVPYEGMPAQQSGYSDDFTRHPPVDDDHMPLMDQNRTHYDALQHIRKGSAANLSQHLKAGNKLSFTYQNTDWMRDFLPSGLYGKALKWSGQAEKIAQGFPILAPGFNIEIDLNPILGTDQQREDIRRRIGFGTGEYKRPAEGEGLPPIRYFYEEFLPQIWGEGSPLAEKFGVWDKFLQYPKGKGNRANAEEVIQMIKSGLQEGDTSAQQAELLERTVRAEMSMQERIMIEAFIEMLQRAFYQLVAGDNVALKSTIEAAFKRQETEHETINKLLEKQELVQNLQKYPLSFAYLLPESEAKRIKTVYELSGGWDEKNLKLNEDKKQDNFKMLMQAPKATTAQMTEIVNGLPNTIKAINSFVDLMNPTKFPSGYREEIEKILLGQAPDAEGNRTGLIDRYRRAYTEQFREAFKDQNTYKFPADGALVANGVTIKVESWPRLLDMWIQLYMAKNAGNSAEQLKHSWLQMNPAIGLPEAMAENPDAWFDAILEFISKYAVPTEDYSYSFGGGGGRQHLAHQILSKFPGYEAFAQARVARFEQSTVDNFEQQAIDWDKRLAELATKKDNNEDIKADSDTLRNEMQRELDALTKQTLQDRAEAEAKLKQDLNFLNQLIQMTTDADKQNKFKQVATAMQNRQRYNLETKQRAIKERLQQLENINKGKTPKKPVDSDPNAQKADNSKVKIRLPHVPNQEEKQNMQINIGDLENLKTDDLLKEESLIILMKLMINALGGESDAALQQELSFELGVLAQTLSPDESVATLIAPENIEKVNELISSLFEKFTEVAETNAEARPILVKILTAAKEQLAKKIQDTPEGDAEKAFMVSFGERIDKWLTDVEKINSELPDDLPEEVPQGTDEAAVENNPEWIELNLQVMGLLTRVQATPEAFAIFVELNKFYLKSEVQNEILQNCAKALDFLDANLGQMTEADVSMVQKYLYFLADKLEQAISTDVPGRDELITRLRSWPTRDQDNGDDQPAHPEPSDSGGDNPNPTDIGPQEKDAPTNFGATQVEKLDLQKVAQSERLDQQVVVENLLWQNASKALLAGFNKYGIVFDLSKERKTIIEKIQELQTKLEALAKLAPGAEQERAKTDLEKIYAQIDSNINILLFNLAKKYKEISTDTNFVNSIRAIKPALEQILKNDVFQNGDTAHKLNLDDLNKRLDILANWPDSAITIVEYREIDNAKELAAKLANRARSIDHPGYFASNVKGRLGTNNFQAWEVEGDQPDSVFRYKQHRVGTALYNSFSRDLIDTSKVIMGDVTLGIPSDVRCKNPGEWDVRIGQSKTGEIRLELHTRTSQIQGDNRNGASAFGIYLDQAAVEHVKRMLSNPDTAVEFLRTLLVDVFGGNIKPQNFSLIAADPSKQYTATELPQVVFFEGTESKLETAAPKTQEKPKNRPKPKAETPTSKLQKVTLIPAKDLEPRFKKMKYEDFHAYLGELGLSLERKASEPVNEYMLRLAEVIKAVKGSHLTKENFGLSKEFASAERNPGSLNWWIVTELYINYKAIEEEMMVYMIVNKTQFANPSDKKDPELEAFSRLGASLEGMLSSKYGVPPLMQIYDPANQDPSVTVRGMQIAQLLKQGQMFGQPMQSQQPVLQRFDSQELGKNIDALRNDPNIYPYEHVSRTDFGRIIGFNLQPPMISNKEYFESMNSLADLLAAKAKSGDQFYQPGTQLWSVAVNVILAYNAAVNKLREPGQPKLAYNNKGINKLMALFEGAQPRFGLTPPPGKDNAEMVQICQRIAETMELIRDNKKMRETTSYEVGSEAWEKEYSSLVADVKLIASIGSEARKNYISRLDRFANSTGQEKATNLQKAKIDLFKRILKNQAAVAKLVRGPNFKGLEKYLEIIEFDSEVSNQADTAVARADKAFKAKSKFVHPDVNKTENAEAEFKELNEAYETLSLMLENPDAEPLRAFNSLANDLTTIQWDGIDKNLSATKDYYGNTVKLFDGLSIQGVRSATQEIARYADKLNPDQIDMAEVEADILSMLKKFSNNYSELRVAIESDLNGFERGAVVNNIIEILNLNLFEIVERAMNEYMLSLAKVGISPQTRSKLQEIINLSTPLK